MKPGSRLVALLIVMAAAGLPACRNKETPEAGKSAAVAPQPTADPHPPIAILNTPEEGATVPNKSWGTGWALDDSGILQVTAIAENGLASPAKTGQPFPGVKEAYPNMPDNDKAGFIFGMPELPPGPHTLKIEIIAKDGGKIVLTRNYKAQ